MVWLPVAIPPPVGVVIKILPDVGSELPVALDMEIEMRLGSLASVAALPWLVVVVLLPRLLSPRALVLVLLME